jgi:AcrR family transcriptional regulator
VHYYFGTMDNLFVELWRRYSQHFIVRRAQAVLAPHPLRALWECDVNRQDTALGAELMGLARHRKGLRDEIARTIEKLRAMQASALSQIMEQYGLRRDFVSPEILSVFMVGLARILVIEDELGITAGQAEARALIEDWITRLEDHASGGLGAATR